MASNDSDVFKNETHNFTQSADFYENGADFGKREVFKQMRLIVNCIWGLSALVGIPGNLLVIVAILRLSPLKTVSNVLIFNLAFADLCFLSLTPLVIIHTVVGHWIFGVAACKLFLTSNGINQFSSATFLALLSLDRFLAVCHPIWSRQHRTPKLAVIVSLLCWTFVSIEMTPLLLFGDLVQVYPDDKPEEKQCMVYWKSSRRYQNSSLDTDSNSTTEPLDLGLLVLEDMAQTRKIFTFYSFVLSYLVPLLCVWIFYSRIIYNLFLKRTLAQGSRRGSRQQASKVTIMVFAIVSAYTVFWFPFWFVQLSIEMHADWTNDVVALVCISYAAYALQYINSALNPFLYAFLTNAFVDTLKQSLCGGKRRGSDRRNTTQAAGDHSRPPPVRTNYTDITNADTIAKASIWSNWSAIFPRLKRHRSSKRLLLPSGSIPTGTFNGETMFPDVTYRHNSVIFNEDVRICESSSEESDQLLREYREATIATDNQSWIAVLVHETGETYV